MLTIEVLDGHPILAAMSSKTSASSGAMIGRPLAAMCQLDSPGTRQPKETFGFECETISSPLSRPSAAASSASVVTRSWNMDIIDASAILPKSDGSGNARFNFFFRLARVSNQVVSPLRLVSSHGSSDV